ncbi:MAG: pyridoxal-phosphate dependent enzyme [Acidimicrobiales bacterium]
MASLLPNAVYYRCSLCGRDYEVELSRITCDCGGVLDLHFEAPPLASSLSGRGVGLARYREALPIGGEWLARADLGASRTPVVTVGSTYAKCDYVTPSGSFKDRGAFMLAALALGLGAKNVIVDSSGNAGAAMAAHCGRIGVPCTVVAPASAPAGKLAQSKAYGATVVAVEGPRTAATEAALEMAAGGGFYASHVENPFFTEGTKTWAFEVFEQLGDAPAEVVMSVGNGSLFLGVERGFRYLFDQGLTTRVPRMVAVQAKGWSPLTNDVADDRGAPLADGIAIIAPRRLVQILRAIETTGGEARSVGDDEIIATTRQLAHEGLWVEPTSATAWAGALRSQHEDGPVVVSLGGAGFKAASPGA